MDRRSRDDGHLRDRRHRQVRVDVGNSELRSVMGHAERDRGRRAQLRLRPDGKSQPVGYSHHHDHDEPALNHDALTSR